MVIDLLIALLVVAVGFLSDAFSFVLVRSASTNWGSVGAGDPKGINDAGGFVVSLCSVFDVLHKHVVCIIVSNEVARAEEVLRWWLWIIVGALCTGVV